MHKEIIAVKGENDAGENMEDVTILQLLKKANKEE